MTQSQVLHHSQPEKLDSAPTPKSQPHRQQRRPLSALMMGNWADLGRLHIELGLSDLYMQVSEGTAGTCNARADIPENMGRVTPPGDANDADAIFW